MELQEKKKDPTLLLAPLAPFSGSLPFRVKTIVTWQEKKEKWLTDSIFRNCFLQFSGAAKMESLLMLLMLAGTTCSMPAKEHVGKWASLKPWSAAPNWSWSHTNHTKSCRSTLCLILLCRMLIDLWTLWSRHDFRPDMSQSFWGNPSPMCHLATDVAPQSLQQQQMGGSRKSGNHWCDTFLKRSGANTDRRIGVTERIPLPHKHMPPCVQGNETKQRTHPSVSHQHLRWQGAWYGTPNWMEGPLR